MSNEKLHICIGVKKIHAFEYIFTLRFDIGICNILCASIATYWSHINAG